MSSGVRSLLILTLVMLEVTPLPESSINPTTLEYLNLPPKSLMSDDFEYAVKALVTDVINSVASLTELVL